MTPVLKPTSTSILKRARKLAVGETIAVDDLITLHGLTYRITSIDTRWVGRVIEEHGREAFRPAPPPDPMIAATKRIRAKTSLGKLEKLLAERATARRRVTTAITHLESIDNAISRLTRTLADASLESDLARINQTNTP